MGCLLDLEEGAVRFTVNGKIYPFENAQAKQMANKFTEHKGGFYPAVSLTPFQVRSELCDAWLTYPANRTQLWRCSLRVRLTLTEFHSSSLQART